MRKVKLVKTVSSRVLEDVPPKSLFFSPCADFEELATDVRSSSPHFGLFIATNASKVSDETIRSVAEVLIGRGLACLCTWGPDCERVHDDFDFAALRVDPEGEHGVIMTTWHSDESLSEALWFFVHSAFPDDAYEKTCLEWVAAGIGTDQWNETLRIELDKIVNQES